jgi:glycine cleavage system transcriptional repressor
LAVCSINITDLNTKLIGTVEEPVYVLMLEVALPEGETAEHVEQTLAILKKELNVEIGVRVITPVAF